MPEEATASRYFSSIISLLSQNKLTGKLRHREMKDSHKIDKRQEKLWAFLGPIPKATRSPGLTKGTGNHSLHQSPQCQALTHSGSWYCHLP